MILLPFRHGTSLVAMIQTTWPKIRVALYKRDTCRFQFVEEGLHQDEAAKDFWYLYWESRHFNDIETATKAMIEHYCALTEDEYRVDPESVTILEAPHFKGLHHPRLILHDHLKR